MVDIFSECFGHCFVSFVGVHDCGENIIFTAYDFYCRFVSVLIEFFCELVTAVIVKVSGVDIENQLAVFVCIGLQTSSGNDFFFEHFIENVFVSVVRFFEVNIERSHFRDDIGINVRLFFPFVVSLNICYFSVCKIYISGGDSVNAVISCHISFGSFLRFVYTLRATGDTLLRKCNNPL